MSDDKKNPLSIDDDYTVALLTPSSSVSFSPEAYEEDVAYVRKNLFRALKIPGMYLGWEQYVSGSKVP